MEIKSYQKAYDLNNYSASKTYYHWNLVKKLEIFLKVLTSGSWNSMERLRGPKRCLTQVF